MKRLFYFIISIIISDFAGFNTFAQTNTQEASASYFFKNSSIKTEYENYIYNFADLVNGAEYSSRENSIHALNIECNKYNSSKNYNSFPKWSNEAVSYICKYSNTMDELLNKNKKPFGYGHCKNLEKAISIFESAKNYPEYMETKLVSDKLIVKMNKAHDTTFGHSWKGGWYGPESYDYKCK